MRQHVIFGGASVDALEGMTALVAGTARVGTQLDSQASMADRGQRRDAGTAPRKAGLLHCGAEGQDGLPGAASRSMKPPQARIRLPGDTPLSFLDRYLRRTGLHDRRLRRVRRTSRRDLAALRADHHHRNGARHLHHRQSSRHHQGHRQGHRPGDYRQDPEEPRLPRRPGPALHADARVTRQRPQRSRRTYRQPCGIRTVQEIPKGPGRQGHDVLHLRLLPAHHDRQRPHA